MARSIYLVTHRGAKQPFLVFPLSNGMAKQWELSQREQHCLQEENDRNTFRKWHSLGYILRSREASWEG